MGWLIALGVLIAIGFVPLGAFLRYDQDGLKIKLVAGPVRFNVYPFPERKRAKPQKKKKKQPSEQQAAPQPKPEENKGGRLQDFYPFLQLGLRFMKELRKKLCINHLVLRLTLAGDDPCDLAVAYGRTWAALGSLMPVLERFFNIRKRTVDVQCDFSGEDILLETQTELTLRIYQLVQMTAVYGYLVIKEFLQMKKKRKGGTVT